MSNKIVVVFARRWFDKANGNSYHSVAVYHDGKLVNKPADMLYGYDNQWETSAKDLLVRHGIYKDTSFMLRRMVEEINNDTLIYDCVDVERKKDLKFIHH